MAMEKRGEIRSGWTPPEKEQTTEKLAATDQQLEDHITKRAAETVRGCCKHCKCSKEKK